MLSPYWCRVDGSQPVTLTPIARFTGANTFNGATRPTPRSSATKQLLYNFPPDEAVDSTPGDGHDDSIYAENQKTFPQIASGGSSFSPTAPSASTPTSATSATTSTTGTTNGTTFHNVRSTRPKGPAAR